jgi:signal transduction histidine kinase/ActR/RegA family two-component response regulator
MKLGSFHRARQILDHAMERFDRAVRNYYSRNGNDEQHMTHLPLSASDIDEPTLMRKMLEASPSFMHVLRGPDFVFEYANEAYYHLVGRRDLIGRPAFEVMPEAAGEYPQRIAQVMATRQPFHGQEISVMLARSPAAPAEERWINLVYVPLLDADGTCQRVLGHGTDVTESVRMRRRAERAEQLSSGRLADALLAGRMIAWEWNVQTDVLTGSGAWLDLFKSKNSMFATGKTALEHVHPDDRAARIAMVKASLACAAPWHLEYRTLQADGNVVWLEERASLNNHPDNDQQIVVGLTWDITQRKQAQEALESAERELQATASLLQDSNSMLEAQVRQRTAERNLFASIVERTDTLVMAAALDFTILAINPANADEFERIYGVRPKVGDNMLDLLADQPEHRAQVEAGWSRGLTGQEVTIVEDYGDLTRTRPFYEIKFRPLHDDQGVLIGCYQFVSDVTQRLRDQASLNEAQEALRQSQKMEAIGQLTGGIAHDFNNMLATISSSLELMNRRIASGKGGDLTRYVTMASTAAQSAAALIKRLLAFSRKQTLDLQAIEVNSLIAQMQDMLKRTIGESIQFELELQPGLPAVKSDRNQLENALLNLTINARDAMPEGGVIRIATTSRELDASYAAMHPGVTPGQYVMLSISDNGTGMSSEIASKAFDPFFTTKPIGQGTGLGLSMIYGFMRQTQGHASIHSVVDQGTTVNVYLPCNMTTMETPVTQQQSVARSPKGQGETVLFVEDEAGVRLVLSEILGELGYKTYEAVDAPSAIAIEQNLGKLDLLVTDVGLPGTNGRQLAEMMRMRRPGLKVLFVTGYANKAENKNEFLGRGMDMLAKPFTIDALANKVQTMLNEPAFDEPVSGADADSVFGSLT